MTRRPVVAFAPEARVLVVDDEAPVRSTLVRALTLAGYYADGADSGYQALQMLECAPYDVMVLDIRMPGMDGVEVMSCASHLYPDLRIIILTGHATLESAIVAIKSHAVDYLLKPAGIQDIITAISDTLQASMQEESTPSASPSLIQAGPVSLDREKHLVTVTGINDRACSQAQLTVSESALLAHLMQHPNTVFSCRELAHTALDYDVSKREAQRIIRPHIYRLRKKVELDPSHPCLICNTPGRGYFFSL